MVFLAGCACTPCTGALGIECVREPQKHGSPLSQDVRNVYVFSVPGFRAVVCVVGGVIFAQSLMLKSCDIPSFWKMKIRLDFAHIHGQAIGLLAIFSKSPVSYSDGEQ